MTKTADGTKLNTHVDNTQIGQTLNLNGLVNRIDTQHIVTQNKHNKQNVNTYIQLLSSITIEEISLKIKEGYKQKIFKTWIIKENNTLPYMNNLSNITAKD